jgi:hypothetical protein
MSGAVPAEDALDRAVFVDAVNPAKSFDDRLAGWEGDGACRRLLSYMDANRSVVLCINLADAEPAREDRADRDDRCPIFPVTPDPRLDAVGARWK